MNHTIHHGDCLEVIATMSDASVDALIEGRGGRVYSDRDGRGAVGT